MPAIYCGWEAPEKLVIRHPRAGYNDLKVEMQDYALTLTTDAEVGPQTVSFPLVVVYIPPTNNPKEQVQLALEALAMRLEGTL